MKLTVATIGDGGRRAVANAADPLVGHTVESPAHLLYVTLNDGSLPVARHLHLGSSHVRQVRTLTPDH